MEYNTIKNLLDKYFEGLTNIQEENVLKNYFLNDIIHNDFKQFEPVFRHFKSERQIINKKEFVFEAKKNNKFWFSIAATFLLIAGLTTFFYKNKTNNNDLGTYKNPELAFIETQKALKMLSENVNIGVSSIAYINEFQKTKNKIFIE